MEDIGSVTGLTRPSLYNAFGNKRAMFLLALDSEFREVSQRLLALDLEKPPAARVAAFLEAAVAGYRDCSHPDGLAFGAALADAVSDLEIQHRITQFEQAFERAAQAVLGAEADACATTLLASHAIASCVRARACVRPRGVSQSSALLACLVQE